ncbi:MerR family transcriptional regulator [Streptomyces sp. NPDC003393]
MRIGELAAIAGVTTRTVRHYHRIGLLPEPERQSNGYREYGLRDAVELARVRRLTELGLTLDEVRDALADDAGKDLREILAELDADPARQEEAIGRRRGPSRRAVAARGRGRPAEGPVSAELAAVFDDMARASAARPGPEPAMAAMAAKERELLALLHSTAGAGHRYWLLAMMRALSTDEDAMARAYEIYAGLDELADASPTDPRVPEPARTIADSMPHEVARSAAEGASRTGDGCGGGFADAFFADFPPAQAEVLRRATALLQERGAR